ncbi:MAG: site-specific integrase [Lachnospiraceae bacterium]|nr:site-specific integrase [Lachnospiraceae bacterium]MCM1230896.1 site-specific integrase [Ruminococcus flavefaciens]
MARRGENIYKRKDGRWEGRYKCGFGADGKSRYRSVYARTYNEVKEKLSEIRSEPITFVTAGKLTVKELFAEWLCAVKLRVKESTYANYRMKAEKHILPAFGGLAFSALSAQLVHRFIAEKLECGLSPKYVSDIVVVLKSMAKYASVQHNFYNPLTDITMPRPHKKDLNLLSESEQKKFRKYISGNIDTTKIGIMLSYYTGLRIGEVCGLKWSDIDFKKRTLTVRRTVQRIMKKNGSKSTEIVVSSPKSKTSERTIPLPDFLYSILVRYRADSNSYILSGSTKIIEPRTMQYRFKSVLKKANLPSVNYHCLRHMFATNCVKIGFDVKTLSEILGHSSVEITLNRYVHSSMERKIVCMNLISQTA